MLSSRLPRGFATYTWFELQRSQYESYASTRQLLLFIMTLVVLVAAVNVASAVSMLAVERRRDTAILKGFGAAPGDTIGIFLTGAFLTGMVGSIVGLTAGVLTAVNVNSIIRGIESVLGFFLRGAGGVKLLDPAYYLETIPVVVDWPGLALIGAGTTVCSVLAAWAPARRAGGMKPLEILRRF
jgi:lipoprotein-releasing system permease protein